MSEETFEDDRKPTALEEKEPRDIKKGKGGGGDVKLPPSATTQSESAQSLSSRHKRSDKHSRMDKHGHRDKSSRVNRTMNDVDAKKIDANDYSRAPYASKVPNRPAELVSSADIAKQNKDMKHPYTSSKIARRMQEVEDESTAKPPESLTYAPSLVAHSAAPVLKASDENVYKELPAAGLDQFNLPPHRPTTVSPANISANENARNNNQATTTTIMTSQDPVQQAPGAFAVGGANNVPDRQHDDNFSYTQQDDTTVNNNPANPANPVEARLVDNSDDVENLQKQLRQRDEVLEEIQRQQENIVVGQVLGVDNNYGGDDDEQARNNENPTSSYNNKSMCGLTRKMAFVVIGALLIVAVVVGSVVAKLLRSKPPPPSPSFSSPSPMPSAAGTLPDPCVEFDEEGSVACGIITDTYFVVFVDCPTTLYGWADCQLCEVISLVNDSTPDDVTDNPLCRSCSVCPPFSVSPFAYDCTDAFTSADECLTIACDGTCDGDTVPPPTPLFSPPPSMPSTGTGLPEGCFEADQGNIGCDIAGDGYVTIFFNCPTGFSSPGDCVTCQTLVDDLTPDDLTDNPICSSCTTCPTGSSASEHDCSNEISTGCVFLDCNGVCTTDGTPPTPQPVSGGTQRSLTNELN